MQPSLSFHRLCRIHANRIVYLMTQMNIRKLYPLLSLILIFHLPLYAQWDTAGLSVPIGRQLFHDNVDKQQKLVLKLDGKADDILKVSNDDAISLQVSFSLTYGVDRLQKKIEKDSSINDNTKKKYLRGLRDILWTYGNIFPNKQFNATAAPEILNVYEACMNADISKTSILAAIKPCSYEAAYVILDPTVFADNAGYKDSRIELQRKICERYPNQALLIVFDYPFLYFTDSIIELTARRYPQQLYDYSQNRTSAFAKKLDANKDTLVSIIRRMARSSNGMKYFPFLDLIYRRQMSFEELDALADDDLNYYKLLVKTQISYWERVLKNDIPMVHDSLTSKLEKFAKELFIKPINELHESPDGVRFKAVEQLNPQELYYVIVLGEEEIYTSSYLGVYKRMFERMKLPKGDSLLLSVKFDHFSKFLKMAAAYNTLDEFGKTIDKESFLRLMKAFVNWPDRPNVNSIEAAVDVADAFASISNKEVSDLMLEQVNANCEKAVQNNNRKSTIIYNILSKLMLSKDTANHVDLTAELGIPPVYAVAYNEMLDSGKVIAQVFFYGDDDGKTSFTSFMSLFNKTDWTFTRKHDPGSKEDEWIEIKSIKGKPVWIFANLPLEDKTLKSDPDDEAQRHLTNYLVDHSWYPTLVIHRGHSYHLQYTIRRMKPSTRIVVLGSCGGYKSLNDVLSISDDAHIIASKQVGARGVNEPILRAMLDDLTKGKNIDWIPLWKGVEATIKDPTAKERFSDYIPPYKNLGAIFIKAYKKAMEE